jgi:hypothetical protein
LGKSFSAEHLWQLKKGSDSYKRFNLAIV